MKKLRLDSGVETYSLPGGGVLRFNPADPALHLRLERLQTQTENLTGTVEEVDRQVKNLLNQVLGPGNDLDKALGGVSLFAVTQNGNTVLQNLLDALTPIFQEGAERCAQNQERW